MSYRKILLSLGVAICFITKSNAQENSAAGNCYHSNGGTYLEIDAQLQGTSYLGGSERVEIEVIGGYYGHFGKHTYMIEARDGLEVSAYQINENVSGYELKIFDNGNASNHQDKYVIGVNIPGGSYRSICVRARELKSRQWLDVTSTTMPSLTEVTYTTTWLHRSSKNEFTVDGKLGVGTTTPQAKLHLEDEGNYKSNAWFGNSFVSNSAYHFDRARVGISGSSNSNQFGAGIHFQVRNNSNTNYLHAIVGQSRDGRIVFETGGAGVVSPTEKMTILSSGEVGIGTSNTFGYKLAVNGTIASKEVNVETTSDWPDYVFSTTYDLKPLEEVSEYIDTNGHLPNIPSAKEVSENGIKLGEMNAKLLEKVEELTLYLIEQSKKTETLTNEVKYLKEFNLKLENEIKEIKNEK